MNPERPSKNTNNNQSCAACKFQRRKCTADCPLAPYFSAENQQDFNHVHRLFGVGNVLKITKNLDPIQRDDAMRSIVYESTVHAMDPVFGCRGITAHLQSQIARGVAQINYARQQLVQLRMAAHQQQQRQQQQQYVTMGNDQPMMPQQQPLEGVPMGYDGSLQRGRSSAAMGRPHSAQEDQNHGVLETEPQNGF
ncbi:LOB domain-containing protein 27 [Acorus calamus]|uniref:LOB domain-containing protein 27 n=1 Tax=Acorus calamus TaxID=4465 RepID=A0AAV9DD08_ACOCL|nr:LOB domain-containing protein 27 [Acorus calamus]